MRRIRLRIHHRVCMLTIAAMTLLSQTACSLPDNFWSAQLEQVGNAVVAGSSITIWKAIFSNATGL